jgi:hypothetical protein
MQEHIYVYKAGSVPIPVENLKAYSPEKA